MPAPDPVTLSRWSRIAPAIRAIVPSVRLIEAARELLARANHGCECRPSNIRAAGRQGLTTSCSRNLRATWGSVGPVT